MTHGAVAGIAFSLPQKAWLPLRTWRASFRSGQSRKLTQKRVSGKGISPRKTNAPRIWPNRPLVSYSSPAYASPPLSISSFIAHSSPDYFLPTTACILQDRLGIPTTAGAYDFNLGCSGYIYGLGQAEGLIATGQASSVLLLTAETYSKFIHPQDRM